MFFALPAFTFLSLAAPPDPQGAAYFEQHVRPLLVEHCLACHGQDPKKIRGGLRLDSRAGWMKGGDNGPSIVPGEPDKSLLVKAIRYHDADLKMPPKGKLEDKQIAVFTEWIKLGAPDPRDGSLAASARVIDIEAAKRQWAFQPLKPVTVPEVRDAAWCRTPIDRFILAKQEAKGIKPNPAAERRILIRRASFDLTGLPPTPEEVDRFVADTDPEAYSKLIDRLLASPHFGERWARHWLDLARFGESHGYEQDYDRPTAYHYRDFVIKAFNQDLPYDTFVRWQIAGDELAPSNHLALMATGFLAAGTHATQITANQAEKERYDELDDMARTIGTTMLGLTVGCARCHDHKFDPIPMSDYYRLAATFSTTVRSDMEMDLDPESYGKAKAAHDAELAKLKAALAAFEQDDLPSRFNLWLLQGPHEVPKGNRVPQLLKELIAALAIHPDLYLTDMEIELLRAWHRSIDPEMKKRTDAVAAHGKKAPQKPKVLICSEGVPAIRLHTQGQDFYDPVYQVKRGDPNQKGEVAKAGFLRVLMRTPEQDARWPVSPKSDTKLSYRRTALVNWITDVECGAGQLLARVIVNRLWHYHFGRGIVATPSDFGAQGSPPSHPELLDFLAAELIRNGWRLKPIHKLILTSAAWMQNGASDEAQANADRENTLFWRLPARRLEAEAIRDAMLAVGGTLDRTMYGPGTLDPNHKRRSIYFFVKRSQLVPMMMLFDAPDSLQDIGVRQSTTIAPQALLLLNNPAVRAAAEGFAKRIKDKGTGTVDAAFMLAFGRKPSDKEHDAADLFLRDRTRFDNRADAGDRALVDLCHSLMCLNEFVYVE